MKIGSTLCCEVLLVGDVALVVLAFTTLCVGKSANVHMEYMYA